MTEYRITLSALIAAAGIGALLGALLPILVK